MFDTCAKCLKPDATPIVFIGDIMFLYANNVETNLESLNLIIRYFKKQYEFLNYSIEIEKDHLKQYYTEIGFARLLNLMNKLYIINAELYYFCKNWVEKTEKSNSISE